MGRPPLPVGTHGKIRYSKTRTGWRARTQYRAFDGCNHEIERSGKTKTAAEHALKIAIQQEMQTPSGSEITSSTRFNAVADLWLDWQERRVASGERAPGTLDNYRSVLKNHVRPALGELRLHEVTVPRLDKFLPALQRKSSAAHARTARAVVGGILRYAARHGAIGANPVAEVEPIEGGGKSARALSADERRQWLTQLEADEKAVRWDLPDLSRFMMATGVRIGEALALYWEDVNLTAQTVNIRYTVVRVKGRGLVRRSTKTKAGERILPLPGWAVDLLRVRHKAAEEDCRPADSPVFPSSIGGLRDASGTRRALRETRGSDGFAWVTSHVFRKTAATIMDEHGLSARLIADHLGHAKPSMTQDVYMGRRAGSTAAADALEALEL